MLGLTKLKIYAFIGAAFSALLIILKLKNKKIDDLKEENAGHEKLAEITDKAEVTWREAEIEEEKSVDEIVFGSWRDKI